ncbi:MAG TPA: LuxR family transcriptional regulator [Casimicrobiaceae bacterium]|jgi:DNA-binding CsgD family transcriptional regulator|nr:LuxR family transcriptional regulator [Casimicrobiaceae bacterium]
MLIYLRPNQSAAGRMRASTSVMSPLLASVERGEPLESCVQSAVEAFGFTSFVFGMTTAQRPDKDSQFYFCTSAPSQWAAEYDAKSYIEIDPRIAHCWIRLVPLIWDAQIADGNPKVERFLERAALHGIGSGACVTMRDDSHAKIIFSVNAPDRHISAETRDAWSTRLGDIMLLAVHVHSVFATSIVAKGVPPLQCGAALSPRETQCLDMAAHGLTSADIGLKLGLAERTVNFHFSNIISKLAVANRGEAIAFATSRKLISH